MIDIKSFRTSNSTVKAGAIADCQTDDKFGESLPEHSQIPLFLAENLR
jgi:hypothetical protein